MVYFKTDGNCNAVEYKGKRVLDMGEDWIVNEVWVYEYDEPMIKLTITPKKPTTLKIVEE